MAFSFTKSIEKNWKVLLVVMLVIIGIAVGVGVGSENFASDDKKCYGGIVAKENRHSCNRWGGGQPDRLPWKPNKWAKVFPWKPNGTDSEHDCKERVKGRLRSSCRYDSDQGVKWRYFWGTYKSLKNEYGNKPISGVVM
jgi:hypothetical protein